MIKRSIGKVLIILLLSLIIMSSTNSCFAITDVTEGIWSTWEPTIQDSSALSDKVGGILGAITVIGILVSVGSLAIIGIKTMLGSVEEKASYKQKMVPWLTGAIMVFAITTIPTIIYNFTTGTVGNSGITGEYGTYADYITGYDQGIEFAKGYIENATITTDANRMVILAPLSKKANNLKTLYYNDEGVEGWVNFEKKGYYEAIASMYNKVNNAELAKVVKSSKDYINGYEYAKTNIQNGTINKENYMEKFENIVNASMSNVISDDYYEGFNKRLDMQVRKWNQEEE